MDRDKPLQSSRALPNTNLDREKYPAQNCKSPSIKPILPLTADLNAVRQQVASLQPGGSTNTVIGLAWGLNILNPSAPLGNGAAPASRKPQRNLVFLTDGYNNASRHYSTLRNDRDTESTKIDDDMRELCRDARATDVRIFTVRVIQGNDALLRACATDPVDFYPISNASELTPVLRAIGGKIKQLRLSS